MEKDFQGEESVRPKGSCDDKLNDEYGSRMGCLALARPLFPSFSSDLRRR